MCRKFSTLSFSPGAASTARGRPCMGRPKGAERPGFPGYSFGLDETRDEEPSTESIPLADLPQTDAAGKAEFAVLLDKVPASSKPLEANVVVPVSYPHLRAHE